MSESSRSSSTPPECQKCGMGMLVATKEQFAARICGSCERSSTPPSPPHEGPGPRLSVEMQRDLARAMGYNIPATPSSPDLK